MNQSTLKIPTLIPTTIPTLTSLIIHPHLEKWTFNLLLSWWVFIVDIGVRSSRKMVVGIIGGNMSWLSNYIQYHVVWQVLKDWKCTPTCGRMGGGGSRGSVHTSLSWRPAPSRVPYTGVTVTPYCEPGSRPVTVAEVPRTAYCLSEEELTPVEPLWSRRRSTCNKPVHI